MNRRALLVTLVLLAVGVGLDVVTDSKNLPGYSAAVGLVGGIAIVLVSKWAGRLLSRSEDLFREDLAGPVAPAHGEAVHDG